MPTKIYLVKAMVFPVVMYGCEGWTIKKAECQKIDAFVLWCWRRFLRVPWTVRRPNQSVLKEINPGYSLEGLMLKMKAPILRPPDAKSQFNSVQSLSRVRLFATPWIPARQASLFITISRSSLRLTSVESVMPSSHLILSRPLLLLPPIPPSTRVFANESTLRMRGP